MGIIAAPAPFFQNEDDAWHHLIQHHYLSYKGSGSISDSLFSSYHVIGNVCGHFVLLTGQQSSGNYYSHDPGKSSNPVYGSSQVYSVRLYYK